MRRKKFCAHKIYNRKVNTLPTTSLTDSVPIDIIFVSPQLQNITWGRWIKIEDSIGDHRSLYIDIPIQIYLVKILSIFIGTQPND